MCIRDSAYADRPEGDLTRIRASLVSEGALFQFAQEIDLGEYLRLGRGGREPRASAGHPRRAGKMCIRDRPSYVDKTNAATIKSMLPYA